MINGLILAAAVVAADVQVMESKKLAAIRESLPDLADDEWHDILHSGRVQWYTDEEMPQAYQRVAKPTVNGVGSTSFHDPHYNVSGDPDEHRRGGAGNANKEFPWNLKPGGAHLASTVTSVKGLLLPEGKPVVYFRELKTLKHPSNVVPHGVIRQEHAVDWVFPVDSVAIEMLYMGHGGTDYPFEVRFRRKVQKDWEVELFRPFATAEQLADELERLGDGPYRKAAIAKLRAPEEQKTFRLVDDHHPVRAFDETEHISELPILDSRDVIAFLDDRKYVSTIGETWKQDAIAPTNPTKYFNLVPPDYFASHVGNSAAHCMNCHESAGDHTNDFHPAANVRLSDGRIAFRPSRGWYGRVRGSKSDRVFTWHPIDIRGISPNGAHRPAYLRQAFLDAGIVEKYDPAKHSQEDYQRTEGRNE